MWTGYTGTAEPAEPLNEDEDVVVKASEAMEQTKIQVDSIISSPATENLSWLTKFILLALIVGACYAFVKSYSPRRTPAGRHGAYEKGGLPQ